MTEIVISRGSAWIGRFSIEHASRSILACLCAVVVFSVGIIHPVVADPPSDRAVRLLTDVNSTTSFGGSTDTRDIYVGPDARVYLTTGDTLYCLNSQDDSFTSLQTFPGSSQPPLSGLLTVDNSLHFAADDGAYGLELWKTDGTPEGTRMVTDANPGSGNGATLTRPKTPGISETPQPNMVYDPRTNHTYGFFLQTVEGKPVYWLCKYGFEGDTFIVVKEFHGLTQPPGNLCLGANSTTNTTDLYFTISTQDTGNELWYSDGTEAGTTLVIDINPGTGSGVDYHDGLTAAGNKVFFIGNDNTHGAELWSSNGTATGTQMVKEINPTSDYNPPISLYPWNDLLYFAAYDGGAQHGGHGYELWRSDGTATGTWMVSDLNTGTGSSIWMGQSPWFSVFGSYMYFTAYDAQYNMRLYKTDGTAGGTQPVFTPSDPRRSNPRQVTAVNNTIFYTDDMALWKTDGTEAGTTLVRNFSTGGYSESIDPPSLLTKHLDDLLFMADDSTHGRELWRSRPPYTEQTTQMVSDLSKPKSDSILSGTIDIQRMWEEDRQRRKVMEYIDPISGPEENPLEGLVVFLAKAAEFIKTEEGKKWLAEMQTDGTPEGTQPLPKPAGSQKGGTGKGQDTDATVLVDSDIPSLAFREVREMASAQGILILSADDGVHDVALWRSDGTGEGTFLLKDLNTQLEDPGPAHLTAFKNRVFFNGNDSATFWYDNSELWVTDGTVEGTIPFYKFSDRDIYGGDPREFCVAGNVMFFSARGVQQYLPEYDIPVWYGHELWKTDGTPDGTVMVKDINPGYDDYGSFPQDLTVAGDSRVFFTAHTDDIGRELYFSDGTTDGTHLVKDLLPGVNDVGPSNLTFVNGILLFALDDGQQGTELWCSDGTEAGTQVLMDIWPGPGSSDPQYLCSTHGVVYFSAVHPESGRELWKSDGTVGGTVLVKDIVPGTGSSLPQAMMPYGSEGLVFFAADDGVSGRELWKSDGTAEGTILAKDIFPGAGSSDPTYLMTGGTLLLFYADDGVHGSEPWVVNPALENTSVGEVWRYH